MSRHIKLNNSSVSDYFKAKALDKGWIKEEVIEKKASDEINISDNLDVNISTLILQLKEAGLKDLAGELTDSFVYYKRAASGLYNVTKDEYNKLTHLAHPKGSTKLQNMNGDCVVEDTYDTQKALMSLLKEKKRVKKAQSNSVYTQYPQLKTIANKIKNNIEKIRKIITDKISESDKNQLLNILGYLNNHPPDSNNLYNYKKSVLESRQIINNNISKILNSEILNTIYSSLKPIISKFWIEIVASYIQELLNITDSLISESSNEYLTDEEKENKDKENALKEIEKINKKSPARNLYDSVLYATRQLSQLSEHYDSKSKIGLKAYIQEMLDKAKENYNSLIENEDNNDLSILQEILKDVNDTINEWSK